MTDLTAENAGTLTVPDDKKSSTRVLSAIEKAERSMNGWQVLCDRIDDIYSRRDVTSDVWDDPDYDLFWASMEIMKPAVYAKPPQPVVSPQFKDRRPLPNVTAELLERSAVSAFDRTDLDEAMCCTRDDLIFYNRGQLWATYETDEKGGGQRVCIEHLDRKDFLHPPARKWSEVPWVARRAWMTQEEMQKRFQKSSADAWEGAKFGAEDEQKNDGEADHTAKAGVWEVWHKADDRVYWVTAGVPVMLDEGKPHLKLRGFFPCPRPAYGTLRSRTLVPVPDYVRYAGHFRKINSLTKRIYDLLDMVRMKGLIPAGGDIGDAVEQAVRDDTNSAMLIPVPGAALVAGSAGGFVSWMPLQEIAAAITGLIEARRELFSDYDRLSGISDIMRGETEASETLGAQRLKSQYGSVRVREKIDELQRIARDMTQIAAEIMAENFSKDTLLEMSQMELLTKAEIKGRIEELEKAAEKELKEAVRQAQAAAEKTVQETGQPIDQASAQQQFQNVQQEIVKRYTAQIQQYNSQVPIEDVMKLLRDDKARNFAFEIETDSTILTDELQEKASRNEFLTTFTNAAQGLASIAALGEPGAKLAGGLMKFALQPYRAGRELNGLIDEFIDAAPQLAAQAQQKGDEDVQKAIAEANQKLAEAELQKAQAAIAKVEADTAKAHQEIQLKAAEAQAQAQADQQRINLELEQTKGSIAETQARIEKIHAEIGKMGADAQNQTRQQDREDVKASADIRMRATDQAMGVQDRQRQAFESDRDAQRADRQQDFSERNTDRQQSFAERQAERGGL